MARWTGTWLSGLGAVGVSTDARAAPGERLGLPVSGPGSVAGFGARAGAFAVDAIASGLVARLFFPVRSTGEPQVAAGLAPVVVLALVYLVGVALTGQTPGMRLLRLRLVAVGGGALAFVPLALRTALLLLLVPALISDRDGRGLHDKAGGAVVVRT